MKHYIQNPKYSTGQATPGAVTRPISLGFIGDAIGAVSNIRDYEQRQREAIARQEDQAYRAQQQTEANQVAALERQQADFEARMQRNQEEVANQAIKARETELMQKHMANFKAQNEWAKQHEQQEKDYNNAWGRDQMALFKADVKNMKDIYNENGWTE